jgi:hypothetical protein
MQCEGLCEYLVSVAWLPVIFLKHPSLFARRAGMCGLDIICGFEEYGHALQ